MSISYVPYVLVCTLLQDLGAVELIRRVAPALPIHGSTQMSVTSSEGAEFAAQLGVSRVVVGRELSVREIGKLAAGTWFCQHLDAQHVCLSMMQQRYVTCSAFSTSLLCPSGRLHA